MAQFLLNKSFIATINEFKSFGNKMNAGYNVVSKGDNSDLKTVNEFVKQDKKIKNLLAQYELLLEKDGNDLLEMGEIVVSLDEKMGKNM